MPRKPVVPAAVADALTADKPPVPSAAARAVSVLSGDNADAIANKDIDTITFEILALQVQGNKVLLAIGQRLIAAKDKLPHGDWLPWLDSVNIPERLAQRYMKLAREWSANPTILTDLGMSKALTLLALPEDERNEIIAEGVVVDGETKTAAQMSNAELAEAVKARKDAEKRLSETQSRLDETQRELEQTKAANATLYKDLNESAERRDALSAELQELKNKPVDVAVQKVVDEEAVRRAEKAVRDELDAKVKSAESAAEFAKADADTARQSLAKARDDLKAASEKARQDAEKAAKALDEANAAAKQAASDADAVRAELQRVRAAPLDDNGLALFNVLFEQTQAAVNQMHGVILKTADPERKAKLTKALVALSDAIKTKLSEPVGKDESE